MWNSLSPFPDRAFMFRGKWNEIMNPYVFAWALYSMNNTPIEIFDYQKEWPIKAADEMMLIKNTLKESGILTGIEHIGSTSIPGQSSKNIIDIMIGIVSMDDFLQVQDILSKIGWDSRFGKIDSATSWKWVFMKKGDQLHGQEYSLFVTIKDSAPWKLKIAFRDYMRSHPLEVEKLSKIKRELKQSGCKFYGYTHGKEPFIIEILERCGYSKEFYMKTFSHIRRDSDENS